jgi:hypothetical protein
MEGYSKQEQDTLDGIFRRFSQLQTYRANFQSQWEEAAELVAPNYRNSFTYGSYNFPGLKKTDRQVDASGMVAIGKFAAICDSMITPFSTEWHGLEATNPQVQKNRQVRLWFEQVSHILHQIRYRPTSGFRRQNQGVFQLIGAFGNGPMFIDQLYDMHNRPVAGIRYKSLPLGEIFVQENHQGQIDAFIRAFRMTARQAVQMFGDDKIPEQLKSAAEQNSEMQYMFLHCVYPNTEYEPGKLDVRGKPWISHYVSVEGRKLLGEGGYYSFPLAFARYGTQAPGETYARGPVQAILPALKTLNAEKATFLKAGHRAADPVLLLADDGIADFSLIPGAINKGSVNSDGKPLVHTLQPGSIQINKEMMDEERKLIDQVTFNDIFTALVANPNMTATQVVELINQKGIYLAPTVAGMADEYVGPTVEREIDLAMQMNLLPPMPGLLKEARGEYKIVHTSPLFKAARAGEAAGFLRTMESALQVAAQMNDPSVLDWAANDRAWPDIARIQDVPESWMASPEEMLAKRQSRAQAQQQQAEVQALPAQAAMLKARAAVQKNGGPSIEQQVA